MLITCQQHISNLFNPDLVSQETKQKNPFSAVCGHAQSKHQSKRERTGHVKTLPKGSCHENSF